MNDQGIPLPPAPQFLPVPQPFQARPAQYVEGWGWMQNGLPRTVRKKHYHLIWPKDGKNGSKWGRIKDIFTNRGPPIHMTISADRMDYMHNRQRKAVWSRHLNLDDAVPDSELLRDPTEMFKPYDFRTRKNRPHYPFMWTDALWQREPNSHHQCPKAVRNINGAWFQDPFYVPAHLHENIFF